MRDASIFFVVAAVFSVFMLPACTSSNQSESANVIEASGTVQYVELEGGFYGILADDGARYDPSGLPDEYQEDGMRVSFRAELREDVLTSRMWGRVVRLLEIEQE